MFSEMYLTLFDTPQPYETNYVNRMIERRAQHERDKLITFLVDIGNIFDLAARTQNPSWRGRTRLRLCRAASFLRCCDVNV